MYTRQKRLLIKKSMGKYNILTILLFIMIITGCTGMGINTVQKTRNLASGMSYKEVVQILGEPKSSEFVGGKWVLKYTLYESWKGFVPYKMVFNKRTKRLVSWGADEEAYQKNQQWMTQISQSLGMTQGAPGRGGGGPNDPSLMQWIAGSYYGFTNAGIATGGTERRLVLCADGSFRDSSESGYSGGAGTSEAWGTANQTGGGGSWTIQGNREQGTITLTYSGGNQRTINYRAGGDRGCFYFDSIQYCYEGQARCR